MFLHNICQNELLITTSHFQLSITLWRKITIVCQNGLYSLLYRVTKDRKITNKYKTQFVISGL